jgi:hypothetical protein
VRPVQELDLTVALDYGQFYLSGSPTDDGVTDALVRLVEAAANGQGIAGTEGNEFVVVISPHQNNFAMRLRVEVWPAEPPGDLDDWQEAFLTGLMIGPGGLDYESPTLERVTIPVPPGRYAVRITGRGFVNHGWPGSTTPGDEWRLQLWPTADPIRPRRLRGWMSRDEALAAEGSGWTGDLGELRATDVIGGPDDPAPGPVRLGRPPAGGGRRARRRGA